LALHILPIIYVNLTVYSKR